MAHPRARGGATLCFNALRLLASQYEIGVVTFAQNGETDAADVRDMEAHTTFVRVVPLHISRLRVLRAKLLGLFTSVPEHAVYFLSSVMHGAINEALRDFSPHAVMVQFPQMAQYLGQLTDKHTILDVQDAYSVSWYRRACSTQGWLNRLYAYKQWLNWVAYERKNYPLASQVWTLSDQDRLGLTAFNPSLRPITVGLPLTKVAGSVGEVEGTCTVGFIGSYGHPPNVEALAWLIDEIVPAVSAKLPNVQFLVAGRNPPEALVRRARSNVQFLGFVDSLPAFYRQCSVVAAPLRSGGGVKIKVAEALSFGKAVVTTSVGVEGISAGSGEHLVVADIPQPFADAVVQLLCDAGIRARLSDAATRLAASQFSVELWLARCVSLLKAAQHSTDHSR